MEMERYDFGVVVPIPTNPPSITDITLEVLSNKFKISPVESCLTVRAEAVELLKTDNIPAGVEVAPTLTLPLPNIWNKVAPVVEATVKSLVVGATEDRVETERTDLGVLVPIPV